MKIESITLKNGEILKLGNLTLLVGPNNVGKSQTLKDINAKLVHGHGFKTKFITDITVNKPDNFDGLFEGLIVKDNPSNQSNKIINGIMSFDSTSQNNQIGFDYKNHKILFEQDSIKDFTFLKLSKYRVYYMDSESKLNITKRTPAINPKDFPKNLMHQLFSIEQSVRDKLNEAFQKAFDMDIFLDYSEMTHLRFIVNQAFNDLPEDPRKLIDIIGNLPSLEEQGDGYRSFAATVLTLLLSEDKVLLIDEPEAFLHPEQARILGAWIAENYSIFKSQILITTHSASFLKGLLSFETSLDIYRLNRVHEETTFNLLTAENIQKLSNSPLLSSQNVLEAIFSSGTIVCEADTDRVIYNSVATKILDQHKFLFIHAHNKQTVKDVVSLLKDIKIPVAGIVDIDIINSSTNLIAIMESFSIPDNEIKKMTLLCNKICTYINEFSDKELLEQIKSDVEEFLNQLKNSEHSFSGAKSALSRIEDNAKKWKKVKQLGIEGLDCSDIKSNANEIINICKEYGLYILPVGELESWINIEIKKNKWVLPALERICNKDTSTKEIENFINEILEFLEQ